MVKLFTTGGATMGGSGNQRKLKSSPAVVLLMSGLQGSGKTTFPVSWPIYKSKKERIRYWLLATYTVLLLSSSCGFLANRSEYLYILK